MYKTFCLCSAYADLTLSLSLSLCLKTGVKIVTKFLTLLFVLHYFNGHVCIILIFFFFNKELRMEKHSSQ